MNELPRIDPTWIRKRPQPKKEESFLGLILVSSWVLAGAALVGRSHLEAQDVQRAAEIQSRAIAASAHERQLEQREDERAVVHSPGLQRCASAKAQRDDAYRQMVDDRNFDFIRSWDDFVYNACKNT